MKWSGKIGFRTPDPVEVSIGVFENVIYEVQAIGETMEGYSHSNSDEENSPNQGVRLNMSISIVASMRTRSNMHNIIYVTYLDQKWKVDRVVPRGNRLELTLGELWHDKSEETD